MIVVPRYYETKRKELKAVDIKKDKYDPKAMAVVVCGGSHGGGVKEFLFQNTTLNEKLLRVFLKLLRKRMPAWNCI